MNIPYLECLFECCLLWGPFWQKKTFLSVFLEKNDFFEPTLERNSFSDYFFWALFWELFSLTAFWMAFLSTFLNMFVHLRIIFLGNAFLSKNTILSSSLSNITFLSVFLSTFLRAFSVERFLSALLSTFISAFFVEHFFECFFEHYKHNSRYFRTLLHREVDFYEQVADFTRWRAAVNLTPLNILSLNLLQLEASLDHQVNFIINIIHWNHQYLELNIHSRPRWTAQPIWGRLTMAICLSDGASKAFARGEFDFL